MLAHFAHGDAVSELSSLLRWAVSPEACGYYASALVLATFCMRSMVPLRLVALCSNIAFFIYGITLDLPPVALLHAMLFPINIVRLTQQCCNPSQVSREPGIRASTASLLPMLIRTGLFSCLFLGVTCRSLTGGDVSCTPEHLNDPDWECRSVARDALVLYAASREQRRDQYGSPQLAGRAGARERTRIGGTGSFQIISSARD